MNNNHSLTVLLKSLFLIRKEVKIDSDNLINLFTIWGHKAFARHYGLNAHHAF